MVAPAVRVCLYVVSVCFSSWRGQLGGVVVSRHYCGLGVVSPQRSAALDHKNSSDVTLKQDQSNTQAQTTTPPGLN